MTKVIIDESGNASTAVKRKGGWTRKKKIAVGIVVIVAALVIATYVTDFPIAQEGPYTYVMGFTQELYAEGDGNPEAPQANMVVFPYSALLCLDDNKVETVIE